MTSARISKAIVIVADKIRNGEIANLNEAVIEAAGGPDEYVMAAYEAAMRKDTSGFERDGRNASSTGASVQLELPGMEHASLPFMIKVKDPETKEWLWVPPSVATLDQADAEVRKLEQINAVRTKVIGGYRATIDRLRELGVPGETTGAEIAALFPREIED